MRPLRCAAAAAVCAAASAAAAVGSRVHKGEATGVWGGWRLGDRAEATDEMEVHIMMRHEAADVAKLEQALVAVSDPESASYGRHLSLDELRALTPVGGAQRAAVDAALRGDGVRAVDANHNGDILKVRLTAAAAERVFATRVHRFHHHGGAVLLRAAAPYSLPAPAAAAVAAVADIAGLPPPPARRARAPAPAAGGPASWPNTCGIGCTGMVTPSVLKERYTVPGDDTGMTAPGNSMSVAEFCPLGSVPGIGLECQYFSPPDLVAFSSKCGVNVTVDHVIGINNPRPNLGSGVESLLDIEYIRGVSDGIPLTVIFQDRYSMAGWMHTLSGLASPPLVHSVSYGSDEFQNGTDAGDSDLGYMAAVNVQFMKAGARGVSILVASGDSGVCGFEGCGIVNKRFHAVFPASSPYVTAVGGTNFAKRGVIGDEAVWPSGGGGFSDAFAAADYQRDAIAAYKAGGGLPAQKLWNASGRGYPDISALAGGTNKYCEIGTAGASGVTGTSAAAPTAAAVFARLNGVRLAAGKPPLGWLNPFIYQNGGAFHDVTQGKNSGSVLGGDGFAATKGWDPASGWGTPDFAALAKLV